MIDIPIGKALIAVETAVQDIIGRCNGCFFTFDCYELTCMSKERQDGKNVIFKLVDMPKRLVK